MADSTTDDPLVAALPTVLIAVLAVVVGVSLAVGVGVGVLVALESVVLSILVAPLVGGVVAGGLSRRSLLLGIYTGFTVGALAALVWLRYVWNVAVAVPITGGSRLVIGFLLALGLLAAVVVVTLATIGGVVGSGLARLLEQYGAPDKQS